MRLIIPEHLKGKELFKFLVENKPLLIRQKKMMLKHTDAVVCTPSIITPTKEGGTKSDADVNDPLAADTINVKVVANTAWWCDHGMDVLTDGSYKKSVKEKGIMIPHIADHIWKSDSHVGDVNAVYTQEISLKELGVKKQPGTTTALIFETAIRKLYNERVFLFYKLGKIKQHSIGLRYISIGLCINDKDYLPEFELWNKYYEKVINKEMIDEHGYFWIVPEIEIIENSCVLFGMNELTPTLETSTEDKSLLKTEEPPGPTTTHQKSKETIDFGSIVL
ncbi:MAG TPA: hypothetical protein VF487_20330 [Chitinophagaceae bacterium]